MGGGGLRYVLVLYFLIFGLVSVKNKQLTRRALLYFLVNQYHPTLVRAFKHPRVLGAQEGGGLRYVLVLYFLIFGLVSVKNKQLTRRALLYFLVNQYHPTPVRAFKPHRV